MDLPMSLRTAEGEAAYQEAKKSGGTTPLADEKPLKDFVYWKLIQNRFPPTVAFKTSHMLLPRRVVADWGDLNRLELVELTEILAEFDDGRYDQITMNFTRNRSVPGHFHLHLSKFHVKREDMSL